MNAESESDCREQEGIENADETNDVIKNDILRSVLEIDNGDKVKIESVVFNFENFNNINNHGGIVAGNKAKIEDVRFHAPDRDIKLDEEIIFLDGSRFNGWLSENYASYSMALLVATAVFDSLPYTWVVRATETLYQKFGQKEEDEKTYGLTGMMSQFGAVLCQGELNTYAGKFSVEIVSLIKEEYKETILKCIWRECPKLHDVIMQWLEDYIFDDQMTMSKRAAESMGRMLCWDYYYFLDKMVKRIQRENSLSTDMLIAQNILILSQEDVYEKNVNNLLYVWSKERNIHYLLTVLLVCTQVLDQKEILENVIHAYVDRVLQEIYTQTRGEYMRYIKEFYAVGVRSYTYYRLLIKQIYIRLCGEVFKKVKDICKFFIGLFAADLRFTQFKNGADAIFIKLCMTREEVSQQLCYIWQTVWQFRQYRQTFYDMMAKYIRKTSPNCGIRLETFIKKVFGNICDEDVQEDICKKIHRRAKDE